MVEYRPRCADAELKRDLKAFGAVLIEGPKWCGKTTTAEQIAKSTLYLQDEDRAQEYQEMLKVKPSVLLQGEKPRLIDEWQMGIRLWDAIRFDIDRGGKDGSYILTGSTKVEDSELKHSGSGRITRMVMTTMSLYESGNSNGSVRLADMFDGKDIGGRSDLAVEDLARLVVRGGWPKAVNADYDTAVDMVEGYCKTLLRSEIKTADGIVRDEDRMRKLLRAISRNVSTAAADSVICDDMKDTDNTAMHINTFRDYQKVLKKLFVIQNLSAWSPALRSKASVRTSDVRHFCDPAVAAYFLNASPKNLMDDLHTFGFLFESLVVRDLRVYSGVYGGTVYHYHDSNGLEADCIVHLRDGRWGAVEVKLGAGMVDPAAANLRKLSEVVDERAVGRPSFLAVVTGTEYAYRREDGVYVVPIGCLRP